MRKREPIFAAEMRFLFSEHRGKIALRLRARETSAAMLRIQTKSGFAASVLIKENRPNREPPEQFAFRMTPMTFAGDRVRARLRIQRVMEPVIDRKAVIAFPPLGALGVVRCSRGPIFV